MTVEFEVTTVIAAPIDAVFDLSLDIDAHLESMAASGERAIGGVTTGQIGLGDDVTWRATHFRMPFTMTSRATELDRPHRFVDEQQRGPFRRFRHEHAFALDEPGTRTVRRDRVSFDAPAGIVGHLVERLLLARYLEQLIEQRSHREGARRAAQRGRPGLSAAAGSSPARRRPTYRSLTQRSADGGNYAPEGRHLVGTWRRGMDMRRRIVRATAWGGVVAVLWVAGSAVVADAGRAAAQPASDRSRTGEPAWQ